MLLNEAVKIFALFLTLLIFKRGLGFTESLKLQFSKDLA